MLVKHSKKREEIEEMRETGASGVHIVRQAVI
jgi:hypothetical protein